MPKHQILPKTPHCTRAQIDVPANTAGKGDTQDLTKYQGRVAKWRVSCCYVAAWTCRSVWRLQLNRRPCVYLVFSEPLSLFVLHSCYGFIFNLNAFTSSQDPVITGLLREKKKMWHLSCSTEKEKRAISVKHSRLLYECWQFKRFGVLIGVLWYSSVVVYFGVIILFSESQGRRSASRRHPDHKDFCTFETNCQAYETKEVK